MLWNPDFKHFKYLSKSNNSFQDKTDPTQNLTYYGHKRKSIAKEKGIEFKPYGGRNSSKNIKIINGVLQPISSSR